jgi:hypothetical protein
MAQRPDLTQRVQFLLINLLVLAGFILALTLLVAAYPRWLAPRPTFTATITNTRRPTDTPTATFTPTQTPTITRTLRPTFTPTISSTPTLISSPTLPATSTHIPSLTPARPLVQAGRYFLADWTPDQADQMALLLEQYPSSRPESALTQDEDGFYPVFRFGIFALNEALLRFPDSAEAKSWRWRLAYTRVELGDPGAGNDYADLIVQALNQGETELGQLYLWFSQQEPRLSLYMIQNQPPAGYDASYLVEVRGPGSAFIRLLQTKTGYEAHVLASRFDAGRNLQANWVLGELNRNPADGDEIAIYYSSPATQFDVDAPLVFNLSQIPARDLEFFPDKSIFMVGLEYDNRWAIVVDETGMRNLAFQSVVFPACPVQITRQYRWNGQSFEFSQQQFELQRLPFQTGASNYALGYCQYILDIAQAYWGPQAVISIMEALLPDWPPELDAQGRAMPMDARDEWLFRLGVQHALVGNPEAARHYFEQIIQTPTLPTSRWIQPARSFIQTYQEIDNLYRACVATTVCDTAYALASMVQATPEGVDVLQNLRQNGVNITSSAYFDFDLDGELERWITVRHRASERLEFWIIASNDPGYSAIRIANVNGNPPWLTTLGADDIQPDALNLLPVTFLEGRLAFSLQRQPGTRQPYIVLAPLRTRFPDRFADAVQKAEDDLFSGVDPVQVRDELLGLEKFPGLTCQNTWTCDHYYYLLGLAHELTGETQKAIEAFHRVWIDYSASPYTIMARLKLAGSPVFISPTPTLLPTATASLSPTVTITGTPPTATPTSGTQTTTVTAATSTVTSTATPTVTGTPPTATSSPTSTQTPTSAVQPTSTPTTPVYPGPATSTPATPYPR